MQTELNEALTEGISANNWAPGVWTNTPVTAEDEWQPDIEPPHINDYAAFKKHKHYGKYFRPYRYTPFPAWMYHAKEEARIVKSKEEVLALGPDWSPVPNKPRIDMTGKSLPVKSETQRLAEVVAQALAAKTDNNSDPNTIAAVVAGVMAAMQAHAAPIKAEPPVDGDHGPQGELLGDEAVERSALIELAAKNDVKIDKRWSNDRIKKELGL